MAFKRSGVRLPLAPPRRLRGKGRALEHSDETPGHGEDKRRQEADDPFYAVDLRFETSDVRPGRNPFGDSVARHGDGRFGLPLVEPGFPQRPGGGAGVESGDSHERRDGR